MMNSQNHDEEKQIPDEESVEQSLGGQTGRRPDFDAPKRPDWMREHAQAGDTNLDGYTGFSSIKDSLAQTDNLFDELKDFDYFDVPVVSPGESVPTFTGNMGDHDLDEMTAQNVPDKAQIPPAEQASVGQGEYTQSDMDEMRTIPPPAGVPVAPPPASALPQVVSQLDPYATRLTPPTAFQRDLEAASVSTQPVPVQIHQTQPIAAIPPARNVPSAPSGAGKKPKKKGRAGRVILILIILFLLAMFAVAAFAFYKYTQIAKTLPDVNDLQYRASQFETTRILDRKGNVLYEIIDPPSAGKRTWVPPLDQISPNLIAATIATEDKEFYNHPGFDLVALGGRALWTNYRSKEVVSGASTITQQLARLLLLTDERYEQTYERKAREIILAAEITRRYSKEQVLEMYLNEIYYGNMSYGVQAASETYFNTNASDLSLWQAAFFWRGGCHKARRCMTFITTVK